MSPFVAIIIASLLGTAGGAFVGLKFGGLVCGPKGPRMIHRGRLSRDAGMFIGLLTGAILDGVVAAFVGATFGAIGATYLCGYWFNHHIWHGSISHKRGR